MTSLMFATKGKHITVIKLLLLNNANVKIKNCKGKKAIDYTKNKKIEEILIRAEKNQDQKIERMLFELATLIKQNTLFLKNMLNDEEDEQLVLILEIFKENKFIDKDIINPKAFYREVILNLKWFEILQQYFKNDKKEDIKFCLKFLHKFIDDSLALSDFNRVPEIVSLMYGIERFSFLKKFELDLKNKTYFSSSQLDKFKDIMNAIFNGIESNINKGYFKDSLVIIEINEKKDFIKIDDAIDVIKLICCAA